MMNDPVFSKYDEGSHVIPVSEVVVGEKYRIYGTDGVWLDGVLLKFHRFGLTCRVGLFWWEIELQHIDEVIPLTGECFEP